MKKLLLIAGLSTCLFFNGRNYAKAQEIYEPVKNLSEYGHVSVRLSANSKYSIVTEKKGWHVETFGKYAGVTPIISNRKYSRFTVAFPDSLKLEQSANKLDKNNDGTIDLDELSDIY